jgi:SAM-dependent methyltransferase
MDSKNFNLVDKVVAVFRLSKIVSNVDSNDVVLDFGCGSTSFLLNFVKKKIKKGVGIDYDVKNRKEGNIEYIKFKFNKKLPFNDGAFDKVFMLAVLEHIEVSKVDDLFLEIRRILKIGGKVILTTPTPKSKSILEFLAYKLKIISSREIEDHKKYYDKNEFFLLAKRCKLVISKYKLFFFRLNSKAVLVKNDK